MSYTFEYFLNHEWIFDSQHTTELLTALSLEERKNFNIDFLTVDWRRYFLNYGYGLRKFVLKEKSAVPPFEANDRDLVPVINLF